MNKRDLVQVIINSKDNPFPSAAAAKRGVDAILYGIKKGLSKDQVVQLIGFGTFHVKRMPKRRGINPRTGAPILIKPSNSVGLRAGKELKRHVTDNVPLWIRPLPPEKKKGWFN